MASGATARPVNLVAYRRLSEATSAKLSLRVEEAYLQVTSPAQLASPAHARRHGSHCPCTLSSSTPLYSHIDHIVLAFLPWITRPLYPHQLTGSRLPLYQASVPRSLSPPLLSHFSCPSPSSLLPPLSYLLSIFTSLCSSLSYLLSPPSTLLSPLLYKCQPLFLADSLMLTLSLSLSLSDVPDERVSIPATRRSDNGHCAGQCECGEEGQPGRRGR